MSARSANAKSFGRYASRILICAAAGLGALWAPTSALAAIGDLTQKRGKAGCVSKTGTGGRCAKAPTLDRVGNVVISPDGKSAYATSLVSGDGAVLVFDRDPNNGELRQKPGRTGCISTTGSRGACRTGRGLFRATSLVVSADGDHVYVSGGGDIAILDRSARDGSLRQKRGRAGCLSRTGSRGQCGRAPRLNDELYSVVISPDGRDVYVASRKGDSIIVFDRNRRRGTLQQKRGRAGCVSRTGSRGACSPGRGLDRAFDLAVSPNGKTVYLVSQSNTLTVFDRRRDGRLDQKDGAGGCLVDVTAMPRIPGCTRVVGLDGPNAVAVSPDGGSVYSAAATGQTVGIFKRDLASGTLTQESGQAACVSYGGLYGCANGEAVGAASDVAVSPDGQSVYVASQSHRSTVATFDRDESTGRLAEKAGGSGSPLEAAFRLAIDPKGRNVYVAAVLSSAIVVFDRSGG